MQSYSVFKWFRRFGNLFITKIMKVIRLLFRRKFPEGDAIKYLSARGRPFEGEKFRAALIGYGNVGQHHASALNTIDEVDFLAVADVRKSARGLAKSKFNVATYADYQEMLAEEKLDVVVICTHPPLHAEMTVAASDACVRGILCEKPIAGVLTDADHMIETCRRNGTTLAIGHQHRLNPATSTMRDLITAGLVGEIRSIHGMDKCSRPAGHSLMETLTHLVDLMRIFGGDVESVHSNIRLYSGADASVDDIKTSQEMCPGDVDVGLVIGERLSATLRFTNGIIGTLSSYGNDSNISKQPMLEIIGTKGRIWRHGLGEAYLYLFEGSNWTPDRHVKVVYEPKDCPPLPGLFQDSVGRAGFMARLMLEELLSALVENRDHFSSGQEARATLEVLMGCYESHFHQASATLPLELRAHPLAGRYQSRSPSRSKFEMCSEIV